MNSPHIAMLACFGLAAALAPANAGPLDRTIVPADAQWLIHIDVEAFLSSTGGTFLKTMEDQDLAKGLKQFNEKTGMDALKDFKGVTVYGVGTDPEDGVLVVATTEAVEAVPAKLKDESPSFKTVRENGLTIYSWSEHDIERYALIHAGKGEHDRLVLAAADKAKLLKAASLIEGKGESLKTAPAGTTSALAHEPKTGSIVFASGTNLSGAEAMWFQKADSFWVDMGEGDHELYVDVSVTPKDPADATPMLHMLQGAVAAGMMMTRGNPDLAEASEVLDGIKFGTDERRITISLHCPTDRLVKALNEAQKRSENRKSGGGKPSKNHDDDGH